MDLFSLLRKNLSPAKKMIDAITTNNVDKVEEILQSGFEINSKIFEHGEFTALHFALNFSVHQLIVEKLVENGASLSVMDSFGRTPLFLAVTNNKINDEIIKWLFQCEKGFIINHIWENIGHYLRGIDFNFDSRYLNLNSILIATPYFNTNDILRILEGLFGRALEHLLLNRRFTRITIYTSMEMLLIIYPKLWKDLWTFCEQHKLEINVDDPKIDDEQKAFYYWIKCHYKKVFSLQHHCRMAIRKCFHEKHSVIYGVTLLNLPQTLKQYLLFSDTTCI